MLQLGYNELKEISPGRLSNLVDLKVLFLQANDLSRIEGLERLTQAFALPRARMSVQSPTHAWWQLRELVLDNNQLEEWPTLGSHPQLAT